MEALNMYSASQTLICCIPLIQGLSLVFSRLQRRQAQFFQEASSELLALVRLATQDEGDDEGEEEISTTERIQGMEGDNNIVPLEEVRAAVVENIVQLAQVVGETCDAVDVAEQRCYLQRRLGLFAIQTLGITGERFARPEREVPTLVMELVELLPVGGLSLLLLFTENQIELLIETTSYGYSDQVVHKDQKRIQASKRAALAGYWALSNSRVAAAVGVSANTIKEGFQITGRKGVIAALSVATSLLNWHSSGPMASVPAAGLTLVDTLLELASTLEFPVDDDEGDGWMALTLRSLPPLQSLQNVAVYAPTIEMRRQGYAAFKKVIQDIIPEGARLQCLQMLISNCPFPSLVSLHLICIKDEVDKAWPASRQRQDQPSGDVHPAVEGQNLQHVTSPFVSEAVLDVIGNVLRPETGAPPELPAQIDPDISSVTELMICWMIHPSVKVQSALNLYRFILIRESSGKTNYTGVLSKAALTKARIHWLLPLRELAGRVSLELKAEDNEMCADMTLAIDSLQSVLHRCIELNEEALARL